MCQCQCNFACRCALPPTSNLFAVRSSRLLSAVEPTLTMKSKSVSQPGSCAFYLSFGHLFRYTQLPALLDLVFVPALQS